MNSTQRHPTQGQHSVRRRLNDYPCSYSEPWSLALRELGDEIRREIVYEATKGAALTIYGSKPASYLADRSGWVNRAQQALPSAVRNGLKIIPIHDQMSDSSHESYLLNIKHSIKKISEERVFLNEFFNISNTVDNQQVLDGHVIPRLGRGMPTTQNDQLIAIFLGYGRINGEFYREQWLKVRDMGAKDRMRNAMERLESEYPGGAHFKLPGFAFEDSAETRSLLANYSREVGEIEAEYAKLLKSHPQTPSNHVIATAFLNSLFWRPQRIPLEREAFVTERRNDAGGDWHDRLNAASGK
ncbi:hypothetical protein [Paraburkholderia unamae]|uniref:Uncharacterized protein n=1 Tax=Paraburkholderia unamae TaxID=219649 RepID=A0ACC6RXP1_9BURK